MIPPGAHALSKERSTVGSASATTASQGDAGDSGSAYTYDDKDKMSESQEHDMDHDQEMMDETSSMSGMSDGNASLVGFGEGAGSTVSGPVSSVAASMGSKMPTPSGSHFGRTIGGHGTGQPRDDIQMHE
jgi:hypothetical protein